MLSSTNVVELAEWTRTGRLIKESPTKTNIPDVVRNLKDLKELFIDRNVM
jgi:hypothetical protein